MQIRNRLVRHAYLNTGETLDLQTRIGEHRWVEKGIEIDLVSHLTRGSECLWESEVTYFYRGRFGDSGSPAPRAVSPDLARASVLGQVRMPLDGAWRFGRLTGDYNGIHYWPWYARRLGFRAASVHAQRVAGICMARLDGPESAAQDLRLWIKGPVYYGVTTTLKVARAEQAVLFGLVPDGDQRSALIGQWQALSPRTDVPGS